MRKQGIFDELMAARGQRIQGADWTSIIFDAADLCDNPKFQKLLTTKLKEASDKTNIEVEKLKENATITDEIKELLVTYFTNKHLKELATLLEEELWKYLEKTKKSKDTTFG